jgi:uncharacterized protein (DUF2062 family)
MSPEPDESRHKRHARIRRIKWLLRFAPRRARFHRYPLIGRFADIARQRDYLWSFRTESVRPAIYAGSILSLMPVLGFQAAIAFGLSLLLRANVMVLIGLQFITTPFTAPPIYYGTYHTGRTVLNVVGANTAPAEVSDQAELFEEIQELDEPPQNPTVDSSRRWSALVLPLVVGGLAAGIVLGTVLDGIWRFLSSRADARRFRRVQARHSDSTPPRAPPK